MLFDLVLMRWLEDKTAKNIAEKQTITEKYRDFIPGR